MTKITGQGMTASVFHHIQQNLHLVKVDLEKGIVLNRSVGKTPEGYSIVGLAGRTVMLHQIMAVALFGDKCIGMTVNHKNENKDDNRRINLELLSVTDNVRLRTKTGFGKATKILLTHIATGKQFVFKSQGEASRMLGIRQNNISKALNGIYRQTEGYKVERIGA